MNCFLAFLKQQHCNHLIDSDKISRCRLWYKLYHHYLQIPKLCNGQRGVPAILLHIATYSLVLNKRPPRLLIFGNFSDTPDLIWTTPRLLIWEHFCFSNYKVFKSILSIRGILTTFGVPELYWRRKGMNNLNFRHKEHNLIPYL